MTADIQMQTFVQPAALSIQLLGGLLFVWTGLVKLADPLPIRRTITALRIPWAVYAALLLALTEVGTGMALILLPIPWVAAFLTSMLAVAFSYAAVTSLARGLNLECACFGSRHSATLGWRQIALLPAWLAIAASAVIAPPVLTSYRPTFALVAVLIVALPSLKTFGPLYREHRAQRVADGG